MDKPSPEFDRIAPTPVTLGGAGTAQTRAPRNLAPMAALIVLAGIALFVVLALPSLRHEPESAPAAASAPASVAPAAPAPTPAQGAGTVSGGNPPADEAEKLKARSEAQDLLEQAREIEGRLKAIGVESWAAAPIRNAAAAVATGEAAYRNLDYAAARAAYQSALAQLQGLEQQAPAVFTDAVARGEQALAAGDGAGAADAFTTALLIRPDAAAARKGAARAKNIGPVVELVQRGDGLAQGGDNNGAAAAYEKALQLDPDFTPAREKLNAVRGALGTQAYRAAMSAGFAALESGDPVKARAQFGAALRLRPGAPEAQDALRLAETRATSAAIEQHIAAAQKAAEAEDWNGAVSAWEAALKLDANLLVARNGIESATERRALDAQLAGAIAQPERLSDDRVQADAAALLARAGQVSAPGARLKQQVAILTTLLAEARTPVPVTLTSDGNTDVNLYRVGPQGRFSSKAITLRPGRYVALGTRAGYRDVRVEFTLSADGAAPTVQVQCTEPIKPGL